MTALNSLISQGGTNIASPIQRYMETKKDMQKQQMNSLAMQQTQQSMGINKDANTRAQQMQDIKIIAPFAKAVLELPVEQRQAAYQQALPQIQEMGVNVSKAPPEWNEEFGTAIMNAGGLTLDIDKGKQINALVNGKVVGASVNEMGQIVDTVTRKVIPGAIKAPNQQETGEPGSMSGGMIKDTAKDKDTRMAMDAEAGLRNLGKNVNRIKDTINASRDYTGGVSGTFIQLINSGQMQFDQILGRRDPLSDAKGNIDSKQLGNLSKDNIGWVRKAAIEGKRVDSAILELAFTHAKILNNSGKISDADIKYARDIIEGGADKATKIDSLNNLLERGYSNYTQERKTREGRGTLQESWKDISRDEIFGKGFQPVGQVSAGDQADIDNAAGAALDDMGIDF